MDRIILLDEHTANQIAAGEVVERPASVVKELIENSLDAGARSIVIDIKKGGIASIRVTDDGEGFWWDDVPLAFERHATSKLRTADDLAKIATLGFRGEALPSIAAVSKVRLTTRRRDAEFGRQIEYHGGRLIDDGEAGCPAGTTVAVSELFYNLPARYKFLKKDAAETAQISELVGRLAVGRPDISFTLVSQGVTLLHTQGSGRPEDAIYSVLGRDVLDGLLPVSGEDGGIAVKGFAGRPEIARGNRNGQLYYVNGRLIKNRVMYAALEEAYRTHLLKKRYPVAALYLTMDVELLDVNAHPAKTEVRFYNESALFRVIYHAVSAALGNSVDTGPGGATIISPDANTVEPIPAETGSAGQTRPNTHTATPVNEQAGLYDSGPYPVSDMTAAEITTEEIAAADAAAAAYTAAPDMTASGVAAHDAAYDASREQAEKPTAAAAPVTSWAAAPVSSAPWVAAPLTATPRTGTSQAELSLAAASPADVWQADAGRECDAAVTRADAPLRNGNAPNPAADPDAKADIATGVPAARGPGLFDTARMVGQMFGTYIMLERGDDLILVDQHAAHERVMFESIKRQLGNSGVKRQMLLEAATLNLLPDEMQFARDASAFILKAGFLVEEFGHDAIVIREIPIYFEGRDVGAFFLELLEIIRRNIAKGGGLADTVAYDEEALYDVACKAAVKGNDPLSEPEAEALLRSLDVLPKPLTCPHGRPIVVTVPKREFDKKFKRE